MASTATERFVAALARSRELEPLRRTAPALARALEQLAAWQRRRLMRTYKDLAAQPRYAAAIRFFQDDLYGPGDWAARDADLARIVPVMTRALPEAMISTAADAMCLSVLTQELDRALVSHLASADRIEVATYCRAYRACDNAAARLEQIELIVRLGVALDGQVHKRGVRVALSVMRPAARATGLGALQSFLERGVRAFAAMKGAGDFLAVIEARERRLMRAILGGDEAPFAEP